MASGTGIVTMGPRAGVWCDVARTLRRLVAAALLLSRGVGLACSRLRPNGSRGHPEALATARSSRMLLVAGGEGLCRVPGTVARRTSRRGRRSCSLLAPPCLGARLPTCPRTARDRDRKPAVLGRGGNRSSASPTVHRVPLDGDREAAHQTCSAPLWRTSASSWRTRRPLPGSYTPHPSDAHP
jgi:hypothetical protein